MLGMKPIVFLGPSLSRAVAESELDAEFRPPAAQGDVYRAARHHPPAIGIIDGYFDRVPAVWHKEILWALSKGIHVLGAASMGALRAAELAEFGMRGVGKVFQAFAVGKLADDDEVAIAHASAEHGYRAASDALVNIRATLEAARQRDILTREEEQALIGVAKTMFYPDRSYPALLRHASGMRFTPERIGALESHFASHRIDVKAADARELLIELRRTCEAALPPPRPGYLFVETEAWQRFVDGAGHDRES